MIMPHYFLPVGWEVTLDGRAVKLQADSRGLMRVSLPAATDGLLRIEFGRTPMRRLGLIVSGLSLLAGLCLLAAFYRIRQRNAKPEMTLSTQWEKTEPVADGNAA